MKSDVVMERLLSNDEKDLLALAAAGKARLGERPIDEEFWELPGPDVPRDVLRRVMEEERIES